MARTATGPGDLEAGLYQVTQTITIGDGIVVATPGQRFIVQRIGWRNYAILNPDRSLVPLRFWLALSPHLEPVPK